uniref:Protein RRP5 homolog n=1 Tax=Hirondellea gigas TaxID=1518452 RepID=A0A2P2HYP3_9CRUS
MTKTVKSASSKKPPKKDRELFSVRRDIKSKKKNADRRKNTTRVLDCDDEQMQEIKKMQQSQTAKSGNNKEIKSRERICYDTLVTGTIIGCCVARVFTDRILVSLPYRMKGFIPLTHISAPYTKLMHQLAEGESSSEEAHTLPDLYRPGQFLTVAVANTINAGTKGFAGVPLSLYPTDVNGNNVSSTAVYRGCVVQCSVVATEDHGYTLDTGIRGVTAAFMADANVPQGTVIAVGSVLPCVVTSIQGTTNVMSLTVSGKPDYVAIASAKPSDRQYGLSSPGTTVQVVITKSTAQGLSVLLGSEEDYYASIESAEGEDGAEPGSSLESGFVSPLHLRGPFDQCHLFRVGQKLQARILFATSFPRIVHLTLNNNVFNYNPSPDLDTHHGLTVGSIIEKASVLDSNNLGLSVRLSNKCRGFCFIGKVPGVNKPQQLVKKHPTGQQLPCKLLAFNDMDQLFLISVKSEDVKERNVLAELQIGMVLAVTIVQHVATGARVRTKSGIDGFVHTIHLTDTNMAAPQAKLPVGKTVQAKLINIREKKVVSTVKWSFYFTLKSLLVNSELPIVKEYSEGCVNLETKGVVRSVSEERLFMEFCNGVRGILGAKQFSTSIDLTTAYQPGSVLQVKITELGNNPAPLYFLALPIEQKKPKKIVDAGQLKKDLEKITEINRKQNSWLSNLKNNINIKASQQEKQKSGKILKKTKSKKLKTKQVLTLKLPLLKQPSKKRKLLKMSTKLTK